MMNDFSLKDVDDGDFVSSGWGTCMWEEGIPEFCLVLIKIAHIFVFFGECLEELDDL